MNSYSMRKGFLRNLIISSFIVALALFSITPAFATTETITYEYYNSGEVRKATYGNFSNIEYGYDGSGNRTSMKMGCSPARIMRSGSVHSNYATLQDAYDHAADGDTIQSQATTFTESLVINGNITVTIDGGYNCDFSAYSGSPTHLKGQLSTGQYGGTLTLRNFIIEQ